LGFRQAAVLGAGRRRRDDVFDSVTIKLVSSVGLGCAERIVIDDFRPALGHDHVGSSASARKAVLIDVLHLEGHALPDGVQDDNLVSILAASELAIRIAVKHVGGGLGRPVSCRPAFQRVSGALERSGPRLDLKRIRRIIPCNIRL